jgi:hypothetical protein
MTDKLCILVCQNLGREAVAVIKSEGFDDVTLATFPAHCNRPWLGWKDLEQIIRARGDSCSHYCLLSGCLATESQELSPELKLYRHDEIGSCFYLFINSHVLDAAVKRGAYLLTPGWLARWRHYVDEWGFDHETAREFFGECVTKLLLLDTGVDKKSSEHVREFADFVDLDFEVLPVGLDFFRLVLTQVVQEWRLKRESEKAASALTAANHRSADYAMVLDLIGNLTRIMTEPDAIESILELFTMLFAPRQLVYLPLIGDEAGQIQTRPAIVDDIQEIQNRLARFQDDHAWIASGEGFVLRIEHRDEKLGILEAEGITFPEYKERYLNIALAAAQVCGLVINSARTFQQVKQTQEQLQRYAAELERSNERLDVGNPATS